MLNFICTWGQHHNLFRVCVNLLWARRNVQIDQVVLKDAEGIFLLRTLALRGFKPGDYKAAADGLNQSHKQGSQSCNQNKINTKL